MNYLNTTIRSKFNTQNININKDDNLNVLKSFLKFLNDKLNIREQVIFNNNFIIGYLDNLTFAQKNCLLDHINNWHGVCIAQIFIKPFPFHFCSCHTFKFMILYCLKIKINYSF